jgi:hypothetical protein
MRGELPLSRTMTAFVTPKIAAINLQKTLPPPFRQASAFAMAALFPRSFRNKAD